MFFWRVFWWWFLVGFIYLKCTLTYQCFLFLFLGLVSQRERPFSRLQKYFFIYSSYLTLVFCYFQHQPVYLVFVLVYRKMWKSKINHPKASPSVYLQRTLEKHKQVNILVLFVLKNMTLVEDARFEWDMPKEMRANIILRLCAWFYLVMGTLLVYNIYHFIRYVCLWVQKKLREEIKFSHHKC